MLLEAAPAVLDAHGNADDDVRGMPVRGGCHCGAIRIEAVIDASAATRKCNCSYCARIRSWKTLAACSRFRLVSGDDALTAYSFGERLARHYFCSRCGVSIYSRSDLGDPVFETCAINVACLDEEARRALAGTPVRFEDGRNDDWWSEPAETRHL